MYVCMYVSVSECVCSNIFSETTGPIEAKFHVEPPWDRGRKFIKMVQVIFCSSLLPGLQMTGALRAKVCASSTG